MRFILLPIFIFLTAFGKLSGQTVIANWGVDGDFRANFRQFGAFDANGTDDWFKIDTGSGIGIIDTNGAYSFLSFLQGDRARRNMQYTKGMSVPFSPLLEENYC